MKNISLFSALVLLLIFLDQGSKYLIRQSDDFYICNKGVAFGIYIPEIIFWLIAIFILIALFTFLIPNLLKQKSFSHTPYNIYYILLIIAGAISNLIDRLYFGCVIDFIDIKIFAYPLFNLADTFIVIGAILTIVESQKFIKFVKSK